MIKISKIKTNNNILMINIQTLHNTLPNNNKMLKNKNYKIHNNLEQILINLNFLFRTAHGISKIKILT